MLTGAFSDVKALAKQVVEGTRIMRNAKGKVYDWFNVSLW